MFCARCYSLSPYLVPPPLLSPLHFDSRCFHSFRPGEGVSDVSYHCQPCNYGIWAPRTRLGGPAQGLVCAYRGGLRCDVKCESEQRVTGVASGKSVPTGGVCHIQIHEPNSHRQPLCISLTLICGIFILASRSVMQRWRVGPTRFLLSHCCHSACRLPLLLQDADTKTHKGTHSGARQSHSSCGITETQTGACAHTHCSTFRGGRGGVAHMLRWPLRLWVTELWWVTTFLASRPVCFPKTVSSIL